MPTYYDSQNQAHVLTTRIGSGGEGTVFACEDFHLVAKIYHEPITEDKAEKLRWMAANKTERLLKVAAWVVDVLHDAPDGRVVGFLMPNIKAKEIHELYSLKSRRVYFPEATWHFLVHTAANLARSFYNLHSAGHIMGDINHGNCVVLADGTVKLIDCDSYSISTGTRRYPCEVGVTTHLAPELQGVNLRGIERLPTHDDFGLAVMVFQLLFLGRHPFAGDFAGEQDKSLEDCIRERRFAYGENSEFTGVRQPPGTLSLAAASPRIAALFERAFWTDDRPEPREWIEALEDLSLNLEQCALHPGHLYFNGLHACPWCEIEAQTGLMLFPFVTAGSHLDGKKPFNIFTVENLIASLGIEQNLPAVLPKPSDVLPPPTADVVEAKRENRKLMFVSISAQFVGLIFLMAVFGYGTALFFGLCAMAFWLMIFFGNSARYLRDDLRDSVTDAEIKWANLERDWTRNALPQSVNDDLFQIRKKVGDYQKFQQSNVRQAKFLRDAVINPQLEKHLRAARFADAEIPGIREKQRRILIENGFETAAEMESKRLSHIRDVGSRTISRLLDWRKEVEKSFVARVPEGIIKNEQTKLAEQAAEERRRIEREIERLLVSLRAGSLDLRRRQKQLSAKSTELAAQLLQTKSNAQYLGTNSAAIIALVMITILTPYFGFIVGQVNAPRPTGTYRSGTAYSQSGTGYGGTVTQPPPPNMISGTSSTDNLSVPDEKITDAEIKELPAADRVRFSENLYSQALESNYGEKDYARAERKIRLAVRLKKDEPRFLNELGYVLYEQGKYADSLPYLNRSLKLDGANDETKIFIAIDYIEMNRFKDARRILTEVVESNQSSYEGFYNLGLAHIGLKDYAAASEAFEQALKISPNDTDSHYELGVCFHKLGDEEEARRQYSILLEQDKTAAEKLRKEIKLVLQ